MMWSAFITSFAVLFCVINNRALAQDPLSCFVGIEVTDTLPLASARSVPRQCAVGEVCAMVNVRVTHSRFSGTVSDAACVPVSTCSNPNPDPNIIPSLQTYFTTNLGREGQTELCEAMCCNTTNCNNNTDSSLIQCDPIVVATPSAPGQAVTVGDVTRAAGGEITNAGMMTQSSMSKPVIPSGGTVKPQKDTPKPVPSVTKGDGVTYKPTEGKVITQKYKPTKASDEMKQSTAGSSQITSNIAIISLVTIFAAFIIAK